MQCCFHTSFPCLQHKGYVLTIDGVNVLFSIEISKISYMAIYAGILLMGMAYKRHLKEVTLT